MENRVDPAEYRRRKNEEKDRLFQKLNRCTEEIMQDEKAYQRYLDTQAALDLYSVANTLLIADRDIGATKLKSFSAWNRQGIQVKKGERYFSCLPSGGFSSLSLTNISTKREIHTVTTERKEFLIFPRPQEKLKEDLQITYLSGQC